METTTPGRLLDIHEAAAYLGLKVPTTRKLFVSGEIASRKLGQRYTTTSSELDRWVEAMFTGSGR